MRRYAKCTVTAAVVLVSFGLWGQETYQAPSPPDLLARFSYQGDQHICLAVSRGGDYRLVRVPALGPTQRLHGKIGAEQLQQLRKLISDPHFRALSGTHGGLIRQESESFGAEILRDSGAQRLQWLNADGESPFPGSVSKIVDWLQYFQPTGGKPFEFAEYPEVCPSGGLRLLQPSVAENLRH
jgi:hypothetical protein